MDRKNHIHFVLFAVAVLALSTPAIAASINTTAAVCDPATPANCLKPDASGNLPTTTTVAPTAGAMTVTAPSVGTSSAQALAAGTRKYLFIQNVSAAATIACRVDAGTAALNTAGSFMLPPLASRTWEGSATPNAAITCIASAAATPAVIESL